MSGLATESPSPGLDAEALAAELWQINHSLVESLARLQVAIDRDRDLRARAEVAELDSAT
jgi:hypothetical protein